MKHLIREPTKAITGTRRRWTPLWSTWWSLVFSRLGRALTSPRCCCGRAKNRCDFNHEISVTFCGYRPLRWWQGRSKRFVLPRFNVNL